MSDDAAAVAEGHSTVSADATDAEQQDQHYGQQAATEIEEDPASYQEYPAEQEEQAAEPEVGASSVAAGAEGSPTTQEQEGVAVSEAADGEEQGTSETNAEGVSTEAAYGDGYTAEDQPGEAGAMDSAPEVTYHISSPGGVAPTSDATHTKLAMHDEIPNFAGFSQMGRIAFHDYIAGGWSILVTFARAFDPVSMTEIGRLAKLRDNFEARSINVLGVLPESVLMVSSYLQDVAKIEQVGRWPLASHHVCCCTVLLCTYAEPASTPT